MATRRKDSKGRVLHDGERERKNGTYEYRYKDNDGKLRSIYGKDLRILREKEKSVNDQLSSGVIIGSGNITLLEMYDRMLETKNVKSTTMAANLSVREFLRKSGIGNRKIGSITETDARRLILKMGKSYSAGTIKMYISKISQCMALAVREDRIRKNPFNFPHGEVLANNTEPRTALSDSEFDHLINFVNSNKVYSCYVPYLVFLRETGLRGSELAGLSINDIDFDNKTLSVERQFHYIPELHRSGIDKVKTKSSKGQIWLSNVAIEAVNKILGNNPVFHTIDGVDGLFMVSPKRPASLLTAQTFERVLRDIQTLYNKTYPDRALCITPHILRHTCISRIINSGGTITAAQYQARHANPAITLQTYTHAQRETTTKELSELFD